MKKAITLALVLCVGGFAAYKLTDTVTVEGLCSHLCSHGGRKAFLAGTDTTVILRCEATAEMGGAFGPDCTGLFNFAEREYLRRSAKDTNKSSAKTNQNNRCRL